MFLKKTKHIQSFNNNNNLFKSLKTLPPNKPRQFLLRVSTSHWWKCPPNIGTPTFLFCQSSDWAVKPQIVPGPSPFWTQPHNCPNIWPRFYYQCVIIPIIFIGRSNLFCKHFLGLIHPKKKWCHLESAQKNHSNLFLIFFSFCRLLAANS